MGLVSDRFGVSAALAGIAVGVVAAVPLAVILNPSRSWLCTGRANHQDARHLSRR
jgi:hypothetical protein